MITITDIASRAGVSRATVSYVLNGRENGVRISDGTRQRVLAAAADLGYRRNALAHAVTTGRNPVLGFLACAPEGELVARLLAGALDEAEEQENFIKVLRLRHNQVNDSVIERCLELRLAGVIVLYLVQEHLDHLQNAMERYNVPVVVLDDSFPQQRGARVVSDDAQGCRAAVQHLVELGHQRIAFISGAHNSGCAAQREQGFREAMHEAGLAVPPDYMKHGEWNLEVTEQVTLQLLQSPHGRPTAIICAGDEWAMVAMRVMQREGLHVPRDVSIIGFADLNTSRFWNPALTTVAQPFQEMGRLAVRRVLERAANPAAEYQEDLLATQLVVRESTAPANG